MARMGRWSSGLSGLGVAICIAAGLIFGAGAYTFRYAEGTSYLSNDPAACANCHVMNDYYAGWQKASHQHVATCNDCHVPHDVLRKYLVKADAGYRHRWPLQIGTGLERRPHPLSSHFNNAERAYL